MFSASSGSDGKPLAGVAAAIRIRSWGEKRREEEEWEWGCLASSSHASLNRPARLALKSHQSLGEAREKEAERGKEKEWVSGEWSSRAAGLMQSHKRRLGWGDCKMMD